jgi:exodeoxyribonuclease VII small subunit
MKFDEALNRLEEIVRELERGDISLEEALSLYEEGIRLVKFCSKKLSEIERRIEVLTKDESGQLKTTPISEEELLKEEFYSEEEE